MKNPFRKSRIILILIIVSALSYTLYSILSNPNPELLLAGKYEYLSNDSAFYEVGYSFDNKIISEKFYHIYNLGNEGKRIYKNSVDYYYKDNKLVKIENFVPCDRLIYKNVYDIYYKSGKVHRVKFVQYACQGQRNNGKCFSEELSIKYQNDKIALVEIEKVYETIDEPEFKYEHFSKELKIEEIYINDLISDISNCYGLDNYDIRPSDITLFKLRLNHLNQ